MIRPVLFHHLPCHSLCLAPVIDFLNGEDEAVIVAVIDAEHLELVVMVGFLFTT